MDKEIIEVLVVSDMIRYVGVPLPLLVRSNGFVSSSGLLRIDVATATAVDGGIEERTEACFIAVKHGLEASGSCPGKVQKATVFFSDAAHSAEVNRVYARYLPDRPLVRTSVAVGSWPMEFDIEIECTALA